MLQLKNQSNKLIQNLGRKVKKYCEKTILNFIYLFIYFFLPFFFSFFFLGFISFFFKFYFIFKLYIIVLVLPNKIIIMTNKAPLVASSKESTYNAGDWGLIPELGRSPGGEHGNPLQYSCLENPMDRRVWRAKVYGITKSGT